MNKVVTVVSDSGRLYYYLVEASVADALNLGQEDIEFTTASGYRVGLNRDNTVAIVVGEGRYIVSSGDVPAPPPA